MEQQKKRMVKKKVEGQALVYADETVVFKKKGSHINYCLIDLIATVDLVGEYEIEEQDNDN